MQEYMLFIRKLSPQVKRNLEDEKAFLKRCETYIKELTKNGRLISAQPMEDVGSIVSKMNAVLKEISFDNEKEYIGGYYHIKANSLDEAIKIAKENPEFLYDPNVKIEVRLLKTKEDLTSFVYPAK